MSSEVPEELPPLPPGLGGDAFGETADEPVDFASEPDDFGGDDDFGDDDDF
jgi:hypothetical protein